jgi:hypothetical protein
MHSFFVKNAFHTQMRYVTIRVPTHSGDAFPLLVTETTSMLISLCDSASFYTQFQIFGVSNENDDVYIDCVNCWESVDSCGYHQLHRTYLAPGEYVLVVYNLANFANHLSDVPYTLRVDCSTS